MPTVLELLRAASESGEIVTIVYNRGSRPGMARTVVVGSVSRQSLRVWEQGVEKTYNPDYIASVQLSSGESATNPEVLPPPAPKPPPRVVPDVPGLPSLAAYITHYRSELEAAGWHLHEEPNGFGVCTRFKNGKPKKTPSVLLRYLEPSPQDPGSLADVKLVLSVGADGKLDTRTETVERAPRQPRPWRIDSWRLPTGKTFRELQPAFALFIDEVRLSDPATAKGAFSGRPDPSALIEKAMLEAASMQKKW